jgi:hypothetical protein
MPANTRPTSPRGIIPTPIADRFSLAPFFLATKPAAHLPASAATSRRPATASVPRRSRSNGSKKRTSTAAPTEAKNTGTKKSESGRVFSRRSTFLSVLASARPAANAPTIVADPTASAAIASTNASDRHETMSTPRTRIADASRTRRFARRRPATIAAAKKPIARSAMRIAAPAATSPSSARPFTRASTTRPRMSSATAAPMMIFASDVPILPMSARTRAVMPMLVAVRVAPTKIETTDADPIAAITANPSANGRTIPATATARDCGPTRSSSPRSDSSPISKSRIRTPSSASMWIAGSSGFRRRSTEPPRITPATSSPRTAGCPMRSASSPSSFAAT